MEELMVQPSKHCLAILDVMRCLQRRQLELTEGLPSHPPVTHIVLLDIGLEMIRARCATASSQTTEEGKIVP